MEPDTYKELNDYVNCLEDECKRMTSCIQSLESKLNASIELTQIREEQLQAELERMEKMEKLVNIAKEISGWNPMCFNPQSEELEWFLSAQRLLTDVLAELE